MKNHTRTLHEELTASVPVKVLFRAIATKKLLHEQQTTLTFPLSAEHLRLLDATSQQTGMPVSDILFHFVAKHLSDTFRDNAAELVAFRQDGEFETVIQSSGNIHIHSDKRKH